MPVPITCEHRSIHVCEMMECLGIEPGGGVASHLGLRYATALRHCETCLSKEVCRDWLASAPASIALAPSFCPNADIFFELQVDQPRARRS
jgi:hypothetical protein